MSGVATGSDASVESASASETEMGSDYRASGGWRPDGDGWSESENESDGCGCGCHGWGGAEIETCPGDSRERIEDASSGANRSEPTGGGAEAFAHGAGCTGCCCCCYGREGPQT